MLELAVVIVTWNVSELVVQALQSLYDDLAISGLSHVVYVVDSASVDNTTQIVAKQFPQVKLIASTENLGFGKANNLALVQMGFDGKTPIADLPRAVYLLNPDTVTQAGATRMLFDTLTANKHVGLVGAQLFYGDGTFQHGAFHFPSLRQLWVEFFPTPGRFIEGPFNGRYPRVRYDSGYPFSVDFTLGATMMLKREVVQQTGMFDENFFMYCEEIDWAWRIHKAGWEVQTVPKAHVVHLVGQSTSQVRAQSIINLWTSRLQLFRKHYPMWKYVIAQKLIDMGMRHKIRQLKSDNAHTTTEKQELFKAYQTILEMARRS